VAQSIWADGEGDASAEASAAAFASLAASGPHLHRPLDSGQSSEPQVFMHQVVSAAPEPDATQLLES
jgi:hypothetical protein